MTMTTPRLREYLRLEAEMMHLNDQHAPGAPDSLMDTLDRLWYGLKEEEREFLDGRGKKCPNPRCVSWDCANPACEPIPSDFTRACTNCYAKECAQGSNCCEVCKGVLEAHAQAAERDREAKKAKPAGRLYRCGRPISYDRCDCTIDYPETRTAFRIYALQLSFLKADQIRLIKERDEAKTDLLRVQNLLAMERSNHERMAKAATTFYEALVAARDALCRPTGTVSEAIATIDAALARARGEK